MTLARIDTRLEHEARSSWNKDPILPRVFTDFGEFLQHYTFMASGRNNFDCTLDALHDVHSLQATEARARHALASNRSRANARPTVVERRGPRLILWLAGPVTPFKDIAPAITLSAVVDALDEHADASLVVLRIDSPGGDAHAGRYICNRLADHKARKIAIIDKHCFSAANYFAAAADRVLMRSDALMMLHRHSTPFGGNAEELRCAASNLERDDRVFSRMVAARRRGVRPEEILRLLPSERYLTAAEAVGLRLADAVMPALPPIAIPHSAISNEEDSERVQEV
jgi:ATP-dependent protease ClpP protease subunit